MVGMHHSRGERWDLLVKQTHSEMKERGIVGVSGLGSKELGRSFSGLTWRRTGPLCWRVRFWWEIWVSRE